MKSIISAGATALLISLIAVGATAHDGNRDSRDDGNRIAGLWSTEAVIGPCNATPTIQIRNTLLFHAGGTLVDNPRFPPNGIPVAGTTGVYQRVQGLGTRSYNPAKRRYFLHLQFDRYVNNVYDGFSTVDREITLSSRAMVATGPVTSANYNVNGELMSEVCGEATSTRL
jgi:hypothetical protein